MADPTNPSTYFTNDHRACDALWAEVEAAAESGDASATQERWEAFDAAMRRHFQMEEEILFPAVEAAMQMFGMGPTEVMRMEHRQMRGLLDQMAQEVAAGSLAGLIDQGDTLLMLIQQHNLKEEGMLYPMCDRSLASAWPQLLERSRAI